MMGTGMKEAEYSGTERIYNFLVEYIKENKFAPSIREICIGAGFYSTSNVSEHLNKLQMLRKIEIKPNTPRAIKLVGYELVKVEEPV